MRRGTGAAGILALALLGTGAAANPVTSLMAFGGPVTLNDFGDVLLLNDVEYSEAVVVGVAGGITWKLPRPRWEFSMELQLNKYFGTQDSWEVNVVPAMIHYVPPNPPGPLRSVGFGLGFSYATELPSVELERGDETSREKWYWTLEAAFDTQNPNRDITLRLHHRSTGSSTIGTGRSTNAVVLGLRQYF